MAAIAVRREVNTKDLTTPMTAAVLCVSTSHLFPLKKFVKIFFCSLGPRGAHHGPDQGD